jgi:hypothetical protein
LKIVTPQGFIKRTKRIVAFGIGTSILSLGAGAIWNITVLDSALFGATLAILGLLGVLSFVYAVKGNVPEEDFDAAIYNAVQQVQSKTENKGSK